MLLTPEGSLKRAAISRGCIALIFCTAGTLHFVAPRQYAGVVPPMLPNPYLLVAVSGVFEILGGIGILVQRVRRTAGTGLIALLLAVYPANIYMFTRQLHAHGWSSTTLILFLRWPFQFVLIWWVFQTSLGTRLHRPGNHLK